MDYLTSKFYLFLSNNAFLRRIINSLRAISLRFRYYKLFAPKGDKCMVLMIDGKLRHGGLADRLYGILNTYAYCKKNDLVFKLYFVSPFDLSLLLQPNSYDWKSFKLSYGLFNTSLKVRTGEEYAFRGFHLRRQTHIYSNAHNLKQLNAIYSSNYSYGMLYNELFKSSNQLQRQIDAITNSLGNNYVAVCFRFQNLLGDFSERNYKELDDVEKNILLDLCERAMSKLLTKHVDILVTSDSITCLNKLSKQKRIHVFPGRVVHLDFSNNEPLSVYEKSFLDFYLLGNASLVYNIYGHGLRQSGFPAFAAEILGSKFISLDIDKYLLNVN